MYQGCRGHAEREPGKLSEAPPFRVLLLPVDQSSLQQFLLCQPGKVEPLPLFLSTWVADMSHQHESRLDLSVIVVTAFSCHSKAILLLALIQSTSLRVYESRLTWKRLEPSEGHFDPSDCCHFLPPECSEQVPGTWRGSPQNTKELKNWNSWNIVFVLQKSICHELDPARQNYIEIYNGFTFFQPLPLLWENAFRFSALKDAGLFRFQPSASNSRQISLDTSPLTVDSVDEA